MTPEEMRAFLFGVFLGAGLGLTLGLVILPIVVDVWNDLIRRQARHRHDG